MAAPLLILDLDETLVHASHEPLDRPLDFSIEDFAVYRRPHLASFLRKMSKLYRVAVWSSAGDDYVRDIVAVIFGNEFELEFVWARSRATMRRDFDKDEWFYAKDLTKVKRRGYDLDRTLIVDDDPRKLTKSFGNAIYVRAFEGDSADEELQLLGRYLAAIRDRPNYRAFEKRRWRSEVLSGNHGLDIE